ncbi:MAG TPA: lysylphosphatidylglycerol synthase domain-containing protein [Jatrophihabitans sp.]
MAEPAPAEVVGSPPQARAKHSLANLLRVAFVVAVLAFGIWYVAARWHRIETALSELSWWSVAASLLAGGAGMFLSMLGWRSILADLGVRMPIRSAAWVFFVGQLGKYLPGSVWSFLAQAELAKGQEASRKASLVGSVLGAGVSVASGTAIAIVLLPFGSKDALERYWWVVLIVPFLVLALHPRVVTVVVNRALRLIRKQPLEQAPSYRGLLRSTGWYSLGWLLLGLHAWLLVIGLGGTGARALPIAIGGFTLAFCLGILFIPAPAGAGIRDVALVVALSPVLGESSALALALLSRVAFVLLDFAMAAGAWLWAGRWTRRGRSVV